MKLMHLILIVTAVLCLAPSPASAGNREVVSVSVKTPQIYERRGDVFQRVGKIEAATIALPATVIEEDGKGYVQVNSAQGAVWLDLMDVRILPPKKAAAAECVRLPTRTLDSTTAATRGAGEGCK